MSDAVVDLPKEFEIRRDRVVLHLFSNRAGEELDFRAATLVKKWDLANWYDKAVPAMYKEKIGDVLKRVSGYRSNAIGWSKTHELMLSPLEASAAAAAAARLAWLHSRPVLAMADPAWICRTQAMAPMHPKAPVRFPEAERAIDAALRLWEGRMAEWGDYGFVDYGMGPHLEYAGTLYAVLVGTGSRWHAPLCVALMKAGKHVYCEKPLVHKIAEARELIELVPKCKVVTQTGTQGGSGAAFRRSIEVIQAGLLGQIREVHLWCDGYGKNPPSHDRPPGEDSVPEGLNWDFWLGPAPWRPFKRGAYHPGCLTFQNWFDFCNGMLAGQGAHTFYLPVRALRLDHPIRVEAEIPEPVKETYVSRGSFRFEFAARGDLAPVTLWWMDGGKYPAEEVTQGAKAISGKVPKMGCLFVGEKGELYAGGWGESGVMRLKGDKGWRGVLNHEAAKPVPVSLPRAPADNHMLEWLQACKGGPPTFTGFEVGAQAAAVYLPGMLALRLGRTIEWDGAAMKVRGAPEADPLIQKTYRTKWLL